MFNFKNTAITFLLVLTVLFSAVSCSNDEPEHWSEFIPDTAPFILVPQANSSIADLLDAPYMAMFDDITPSAIQLTETIHNSAEGPADIEALILYSDTSNDWQPVWIMKTARGLVNRLVLSYQRPFEQNRYRFAGKTVEILFVSDRRFYITEIGDYTVFSESSLGIENLLRTLTGEKSTADLQPVDIVPGSFIINTPRLDNWVQQKSQVLLRPALSGLFDGASPLPLRMSDNPDAEWDWQLSGEFTAGRDASPLVRSLTHNPTEFTLDRYIPVNSATFSIMRLPARTIPPRELEPSGDADIYLSENSGAWRRIAESLDNEIAFSAFAESGPASSSEFMLLRKLSNPTALRDELRALADEGVIVRDGSTFLIQSKWLGKLIGSELNAMDNFYLVIYNDAAILAQRKGLAESVGGDVSRRRVMFYDDDYMMVRNNQEGPFSAISYVNTRQLGTYIQPWLYPQNYFGALISNLDLLVITSQADSNSGKVKMNFTSYQRDLDDQPFRERWIFPLGGGELTGAPVLADISGSARNEVIFSTTRGSIYALATDGTVVLQISTDGDEAVGPPVIYDWYGNNQKVIMQAAGNSVYAWNSNGNLLPNFPITLEEQITTPLTIIDITRNGVAEIIVGTADRRLHILNSRGQPISGWPQTTNATLTKKPVVKELTGQRTVFASAENTIHAWQVSGQLRDGFPIFLDTQLHGQPAVFENHIAGAGLDGNLFTIGTSPMFSDTLASYVKDDSLKIQSLQVSSSGLNATPVKENLMIRDEQQLIREDLILIQSSNGGLFLYNNEGRLRFTASMGQPTSGTYPPRIIDIDRNRRMNLVALADFGRLYAWDILNGRRIYDLPTTGMRYPLIADITGDGNNEIIALTRDGLRAWTIYETRFEE